MSGLRFIEHGGGWLSDGKRSTYVYLPDVLMLLEQSEKQAREIEDEGRVLLASKAFAAIRHSITDAYAKAQ